MKARLCHHPFVPGDELDAFAARLADVGAVANLTGIARARSRSGALVRGLFLDHHPRLTPHSLYQIATAALDRFEIEDALIVHRCGTILPGEPIVLAAAAAQHRKPALKAVHFMMDRLKSEAVFWKREDREDGSEWIEPTEEDHRALARWSETCPG